MTELILASPIMQELVDWQFSLRLQRVISLALQERFGEVSCEVGKLIAYVKAEDQFVPLIQLVFQAKDLDAFRHAVLQMQPADTPVTVAAPA